MTGTETNGTATLAQSARVRLPFYLATLLAYVAAVSQDPLAPWQIGVFVGACAWSLALEHRLRRPFFSPPVKLFLVACGLAVFLTFGVAKLHRSPENFPDSISRFLLWNAIVFVLSHRKSIYDLWTIAILIVSLFMVSAAYVQPPSFLLLFTATMLLLLHGYHQALLFGVDVSPSEPGDTAIAPRERRWGEGQDRPGPGLLLLHFLVVAEIAAAVFILFPRNFFLERPGGEEGEAVPTERSSGKRSDSPERGAGATGIPDRTEGLSLTSMDRLLLDNTPVLRIRLARPGRSEPLRAERPFYLRGVILDSYRSGEWITIVPKRPAVPRETPRYIPGGTRVDEIDPSGRGGVIQHIRMRPQPDNLVFVVPDPEEISAPEILYDGRGTLAFPEGAADTGEFFVFSKTPPLSDHPPLRRVVDEDLAGAERYLELPQGLPVLRRTARLFRRFESPLRRAEAIREYLMRRCRYELGPFVPRGGVDPLQHFLEEKRAGSCVHFATAMTLLARASGLPARVAAGFSVHPDALEGDSYLVRNSDAHAWTEIYFGAYGWILFDATPPVPRADAPRGDPVASPAEQGKGEETVAARRWDDFLLQFSPSTQKRAGDWLAGALGAVAAFLFQPAIVIPVLSLLVLAALVYLLLPAKTRRRLRQKLAPNRVRAEIGFYRDFLWVLARHGIRKHPSLTGWEFARAVSSRLRDPGVDWITDRFYRAKYAASPITPDEIQEAETVLARIDKSLAKTKE